MKAEERKENETNALRSWVFHLKESMQGRSLYIVVGVLVLGIAGVLIFRFWQSSRIAAASARVMELNAANTDKQLDEIINSENHKGKPTAAWAKLQKARLALFADGISKLGSLKPEDRGTAVAKVEEGRQLYLEVANEFGEWPALQQEVWTSCAKAEEVLLGTPKAENAAEYRGSFEKMLEYLRKAAAINPENDASKEYAAKADRMSKKREEIEGVYRRLSEFGK